MKRPSRKQIVLILFAALLIGVGGLVYWGQHRKRSTELYYSGTIEATTSNLAFQVSGRVKEILVDEGQSVTDGQVLVRLEQDEFLARRNQADANLNQAQESLNQLKTMFELQQATLPAEVKRAEAAVRSLGFQLKELESGYRSQEVEAVRLAMEEAQASLEEAQREKARFDSLFERKVVSKREKEDKDEAIIIGLFPSRLPQSERLLVKCHALFQIQDIEVIVGETEFHGHLPPEFIFHDIFLQFHQI